MPDIVVDMNREDGGDSNQSCWGFVLPRFLFLGSHSIRGLTSSEEESKGETLKTQTDTDYSDVYTHAHAHMLCRDPYILLKSSDRQKKKVASRQMMQMCTFVHSCPSDAPYQGPQIPSRHITAGETGLVTEGGAAEKLQFVKPMKAWGASYSTVTHVCAYFSSLPVKIYQQAVIRESCLGENK